MNAQAASLVGLWKLVAFEIEYQDTGEKKALMASARAVICHCYRKVA
jgi:hypothetical protein